jgi:hypothetical protein
MITVGIAHLLITRGSGSIDKSQRLERETAEAKRRGEARIVRDQFE